MNWDDRPSTGLLWGFDPAQMFTVDLQYYLDISNNGPGHMLIGESHRLYVVVKDE